MHWLFAGLVTYWMGHRKWQYQLLGSLIVIFFFLALCVFCWALHAFEVVFLLHKMAIAWLFGLDWDV